MTGWYEWILQHFNARPCQKAGYWRARCPSHDDSSPSLSLWLGNNGAILIGCHANCPKTEVLAAAGLKMRDLYPPDTRKERRYLHPVQREVAWYDYTDEAGVPLYQSVRFVPKTFRYRRHGPKGEWVWNLEGVRLVPYLLHELVAPSNVGRLVVVTEGEKDALNLACLGLLATTNCGGAAMGWLDSYSKILVGHPVVLLPDNDAAGKAHMDRVAGSLIRSGVLSLRLVNLPVKERGDVSDFLDQGGTKAELRALVRQAREWR